MRKSLFFIITGVLIIGIIILFFVFSIIQRPTPETGNPFVLPTPIPNSQTAPTPFTYPPVLYNPQKTNQLINAAKNRQQLSSSGAAARTRLINSLGDSSGTVYSSGNIRVDYVQSPDLFQAEIITGNIAAAKQESTNWMLAQGFTQEDLCALPFSFYLGRNAQTAAQAQNIIFNPLPDGC